MKTFSLILFSCIIFTCCDTGYQQRDTQFNWIKDSISEQLDLMLPMDALKIVRTFQSDSTHPTLIAAVKVDQVNGGLFIYKWMMDSYRLAYSKKEPVYTFQSNSTGEYFLFESGFTGTGVKNTMFYLLNTNGSSITELWKDTASSHNFTSVAPYRSVDGSVQLIEHDGMLFYTKIERTYLKAEMDLNKPDSIVSKTTMVRLP